MGSPIGEFTNTELGRQLLESMRSGSGQVPLPTTPQGAYNTTVNNDLLPQVGNFNFTQPNAPYWGRYTQPMNINPSQTSAPEVAPSMSTSTNNAGPLSPTANRILYQPQSGGIASAMYAQQEQQSQQAQEAQQAQNATNQNKEYGFDNPAPLPNYPMYIPPSMMPNVNAYLSNPSSLLSTMQNAGIQSAGAGRFSNLLSPNT